MYSACSLQNESCRYCEGKCGSRNRCVKRPAVHTVTYRHSEPWSGHVCVITKPQAGWGWKRPLEIISSNHLLKAGSSTAGCSEPCLGGLWNLQEWISMSSMGSPCQRSIITCNRFAGRGGKVLYNEKFEKDIVPRASTHKASLINRVQEPCFYFTTWHVLVELLVQALYMDLDEGWSIGFRWLFLLS